MDVQKIGVKLFAEEPYLVALPELIPVLHRWIQTHAVEGLLIDVADYSHVEEGPGVMLIGHEANYSIDVGAGRMGLSYYRKQPLEGSLAARLAAVARTALGACRELEDAPELGGRLRFRGDEVLVFANDRLLAPNTEETFRGFEPHLLQLLETVPEGAPWSLTKAVDPRERFSVTARSRRAVEFGILLERLASRR